MTSGCMWLSMLNYFGRHCSRVIWYPLYLALLKAECDGNRTHQELPLGQQRTRGANLREHGCQLFVKTVPTAVSFT